MATKIGFRIRFLREYLAGILRSKSTLSYSKKSIAQYFEKMQRNLYDNKHIAAKDNPFIDTLLESKHLAKINFENKIVLDLGCGWGDILNRMINLQRSTYIGIDFNEKALFTANNLHPSNSIHWILADVDNIPLSKSCVDVILAINLVPYIQDLRMFLSNLKKNLKDDGILILVSATPCPFWEEEFDGVRIILRKKQEILSTAASLGYNLIEDSDISITLLPKLTFSQIKYGYMSILSPHKVVFEHDD